MALPNPIGPAAILLVGIGANFPNPGIYEEVDFAVGPVGGAPTATTVLIMGNKTSAGSGVADTQIYGPDTIVPVQTETDVINVLGTGSQLHRAYLRFNRVNKSNSVYFLPVSESAGTAATGQIVVTGPATSGGNIRFWLGDEFIDTPVNSGDAQNAIATNLALWINTQTRWSITAVATANKVAITWSNKGPEGNWGKIQVLNGPGFAATGVTVSVTGATWAATTAYTTTSFVTPTTANGFYYKCTVAGTSGSSQPTFPTVLGQTVTDGGATWTCWGTVSSAGIVTLGGGATADNYTTALTTILGAYFSYIVVCDSDSTNVGRVVTQVNSQAQPTTGLRQRVIAGCVDTLANGITLATGLNAPRAEIEWGYATDLTPLEVAANNAAIYSLFESSGNRPVGRLNFSQFPTGTTADQAAWQIVASRNGPGYGPTTAQITSALNNGLTPIKILTNGQAQLVKRITSRSLNGAVNDYRIRDAHKVSICDRWAADAAFVTQTQYGGKDLLNDPKQGQPPVPSQATTPVLWGNGLKALTSAYGSYGLLQNTDTTNASMIVQRETNPSTRMSALVQLQTADIFDQAQVLVQQVA